MNNSASFHAAGFSDRPDNGQKAKATVMQFSFYGKRTKTCFAADCLSENQQIL